MPHLEMQHDPLQKCTFCCTLTCTDRQTDNGKGIGGLMIAAHETHTLSMVEAREQLTRLPEQFAQDITNNSKPVVTVTRRNKPVLAILPWELYESMMETLEILKDEEQMVALRQGIQEAAEGKGKPWKAVKKELGWEEDKSTPLP
ncbi:MAG: type II toxin-antitoxin system Phd/YefM family antitoxin [Chloroflexi bacterium]|nr:MAG: type II toxin-antitoxin system Phd/YefM family antitoxin [Chloroflexota bacterium]